MTEKKDSYFKILENKKLKIIFLILFSGVSLTLLYIYRFYIYPLLFASILYVALRPLCDFISKYIKPRSLSSMIIIISLITLVLIPFFIILISLADQTYELYLYIQHQYDAGVLKNFINERKVLNTVLSFFNIGRDEILSQTINYLKKTSFDIFSNLTAVFTYSIKLVINIFFMLLILFFFLKEGEKLDRVIFKILPFPADIEKNIINRLKEVIKILFAGNIMIMIAQGLIVGIVFYLFDVRMPLLWAMVTAILSLIPMIGTALVWVPVVLYFISTGEYISASVIGGCCLLGYLILENAVKPVIFGEKLNFHPLVLFFLLLGSIQAFNIPGIIIGPILLTLFFSLLEIYSIMEEYDLKQQSPDTENSIHH
ncbi:MAG: AI-2E family transporter [Spirochaetes bacterium]|nr:AI-2E family transporter [Spirochaetota bacterium]